MTKPSVESKALELLHTFGDDELALKCVNELIIATGAKYWYEVNTYIKDVIEFRNKTL